MLEYGSRIGTLRTRRRAPPRTAPAYPHEQLTQGGPAALRARLYERTRALPGVVEASGRGSMPTETKSFVLEPEYAQGPQEAFLTGEEFSHLHPDGSLHLALPHGLGDEVVVRGWGEVHIDVGISRSSPVSMMIYAPRDEDELEIVWRIFRMSYEFAIGML